MDFLFDDVLKILRDNRKNPLRDIVDFYCEVRDINPSFRSDGDEKRLKNLKDVGIYLSNLAKTNYLSSIAEPYYSGNLEERAA